VGCRGSCEKQTGEPFNGHGHWAQLRNLLVDSCLFQNAADDEDIMRVWAFPENQYIKVHHVVRQMAIYIGEEENCLFKASQRLQNFPKIHNEDNKKDISSQKFY